MMLLLAVIVFIILFGTGWVLKILTLGTGSVLVFLFILVMLYLLATRR